jgi:hypothetical protein
MVKAEFWYGDGGRQTERRETRVCRIVKDGGWNGFLTMLGSLDHIPKGEVIQEC